MKKILFAGALLAALGSYAVAGEHVTARAAAVAITGQNIWSKTDLKSR